MNLLDDRIDRYEGISSTLQDWERRPMAMPRHEFSKLAPDGMLSPSRRMSDRSVLCTHESADNFSDLIRLGIEGKVTRIQYVYFRVWHIFAIALGFAGIKRQVVLSPKHEKSRLSFLHPRLPFRV